MSDIITVRAEPGGFALAFPFDAMLVQAIKELPTRDRRYDPTRRVWIIAPGQIEQAIDLVYIFTGQLLAIPPLAHPRVEQHTIRLDYIGWTKDRGGPVRTASGWAGGTWAIVFPETVLRAYFEQADGAALPLCGPPTLYTVLMLQPGATAADIKAAHRRLVLQWHPDRCSEPGARERFEDVQAAYKTLHDPKRRRAYDATLPRPGVSARRPGRTARGSAVGVAALGYRAPLRCGSLTVEGYWRVGQLHVERIIAWNDITDSLGRTLVSSWPTWSDTFIQEWHQ